MIQGRGIYYDDAGNAYDGLWEKGLRHGAGQQAYVCEVAGSSDIYEGDWETDNRCWFLGCSSGKRKERKESVKMGVSKRGQPSEQ